jgi:type I restriction enzyme R subunit
LGAGVLEEEKLPHLIELKLYAISDAVAELGYVAAIREMFVGFQEHLYVRREVA